MARSPLTCLGYVGPIPEEQAEDYEAQGYDPNRHLVGLTGIEYTFEEELRGQDGQKLVEVDVAGREVRTVGEPQAGHAGPQPAPDPGPGSAAGHGGDPGQHSCKTFYKKQGVAIAMNPQTGEILGMVSLPSYDNNAFTGGISAEALRDAAGGPEPPPGQPCHLGHVPTWFDLQDHRRRRRAWRKRSSPPTRATTAAASCGCPIASTPKIPAWPSRSTAGSTTTTTASHGSLSVVSALGQSCDIFFYQVGGGYRDRFEGLGEERIGYYAELFGMGARTGIDLPGEAPGLVPTAKWKRVNYSESWVTGDTYNMSIGQGFVLATPLQVLNAAATIANGGTLYRPQLVREIIDSEGNVVQAFAPDVIRQLPVSAENLEHRAPGHARRRGRAGRYGLGYQCARRRRGGQDRHGRVLYRPQQGRPPRSRPRGQPAHPRLVHRLCTLRESRDRRGRLCLWRRRGLGHGCARRQRDSELLLWPGHRESERHDTRRRCTAPIAASSWSGCRWASCWPRLAIVRGAWPCWPGRGPSRSSALQAEVQALQSGAPGH